MLADFGDDNFPDVIVSTGNPRKVSFVEGDGLGSFSIAAEFTTLLAAPGLRDLTGDGVPVLFGVEEDEGTIIHHRGLDKLTCTGPVSHPSLTISDSPLSSTRHGGTADLNGDGLLDAYLLLGSSFDGFEISLSDASGELRAATQFTSSDHGQDITLADLDLDGVLDLALAHTGSVLTSSTRLGNGVGGFHDDGVVIDWNEDGIDDFIAGMSDESGLSISLGNGAGGFASPFYETIDDLYSVNALLRQDLDHDGFDDLAVIADLTPRAPSSCRVSPPSACLSTSTCRPVSSIRARVRKSRSPTRSGSSFSTRDGVGPCEVPFCCPLQWPRTGPS